MVTTTMIFSYIYILANERTIFLCFIKFNRENIFKKKIKRLNGS